MALSNQFDVSAIPKKGILTAVVIVVAVIAGISFVSGTYDVVPKGYYQVKQTWVVGTVDAKMEPGFWLTFGRTQDWPRSETFYFTADKDSYHDTTSDESVEVRFNDGSLCNISGTCRVSFPSTKRSAISLIVDHSFVNPREVMEKLVRPVVRNSLRASANLMSARESYSDKRADFIQYSWEQIQNGLYQTTEEYKKVKDPVSGEEVTRYVKVIKKDKDGNPLYRKNPLQGVGISLSNFEVKKFIYSKKVQQQIAAQQEALMAVETAIANARRAEQDAITKREQGIARVTQAKYEEEEKKARAVVAAEQKKRVAEIEAAQKLNVAKLAKQSAAQRKQAQILLAEGEARSRQLKVSAGIDPAAKLQTYERIMKTWAQSYKERRVPTLVMDQGGGKSLDTDGVTLNQALSTKILHDLALDMKLNETRSRGAVPVPRAPTQQTPAGKRAN